jgi:hypothetical protein
MAGREFQLHAHPGIDHTHEHIHMTHYAHHGSPTEVEHLMSTHTHEHDHAPVEHAHAPHENPESEHNHEAHIHDHRHPVEA